MQKHSLLWIILIAVCILGMPAISSPKDIMNRVIHELGMIEQVLGKAETTRVTTSATTIYNALFVETGFVGATKKAMVTEEEKLHSESMFGQSVRGISDQTNNYLLGFSALCFASLVRIVIFIAWLPYMAPFFLAAILDAAVSRRIKFFSFGYSSPIKFSAASHMLIVIVFLPILYLVLPMPVTPLFIPFWALISAIPVMTVISNMQRV